MNLTQLIKARDELTAEADRLYEAADSLDEVIATLQPKAKPRRKAAAKAKKKSAPRFGATEAIVAIVKKKPNVTQAELVARVGSKQEKKSVQNAIYNAVHRKLLKRAGDGGLTYIGG